MATTLMSSIKFDRITCGDFFAHLFFESWHAIYSSVSIDSLRDLSAIFRIFLELREFICGEPSCLERVMALNR